SGFRQDPPEGVTDEGVAKELDAVRPGLRLVPHPVCGRNVDPVRDSVSALRRAPCIRLGLAPFLPLRRMPADRRRVQENLSSQQSGDSSGFGIPLIPADQDADLSEPSVENTE